MEKIGLNKGELVEWEVVGDKKVNYLGIGKGDENLLRLRLSKIRC
jgi:hypothetical protein